MTNAGIELNDEQCIRCGRCLFACPVDAFSDLVPPRRHVREQCLVAPFTLLPPGMHELLLWHTQYHLRGVEISLNEHPHWGIAIAALNLTLRKLEEPNWQIFPPQPAALNRGRRRLLTVHHDSESHVAVEVEPLSAAFPGFRMFTLSLDTDRCIACAACSRVCSPNALSLEENLFRLTLQACHGCGACQAVCPVDAITVAPETGNALSVEHPLHSRHCQMCSRAFLSWHPEATECPICRQHHHGMR
jgi:NAD-dependent dihydropyrimidine dehydrogenase PreA subunit